MNPVSSGSSLGFRSAPTTALHIVLYGQIAILCTTR